MGGATQPSINTAIRKPILIGLGEGLARAVGADWLLNGGTLSGSLAGNRRRNGDRRADGGSTFVVCGGSVGGTASRPAGLQKAPGIGTRTCHGPGRPPRRARDG